MLESELFAPVKELFCGMGCKVNAEVADCDVTAIKDGEPVIIELKRNLTVALLAQALERQKTGLAVYVAVPKPKKYSPRRFRDTLYVLKKLELGLIFVNLLGEHSYAEIIQEPREFKPVQKRTRERKRIIDEINGRALDNNVGGVTQRKIATAFTERSIHIACILKRFGALAPRQVSKYLGGTECAGLLYRNAYGWFDHPAKGVYDINKKCLDELSRYPELVSYYEDKVAEY